MDYRNEHVLRIRVMASDGGRDAWEEFRDRPLPPCCNRVRFGWCVLEQGHDRQRVLDLGDDVSVIIEATPCFAPGADTPPEKNLFLKGRIK